MNPPICMVEPVAQASAAEKPGQTGFGNIDRIGDSAHSHCLKRFKHRRLDLLKLRLFDEGLRIRNQIRFSDSRTLAKSDLFVTDWCRTKTRIPPIGMPVPIGVDMKRKLLSK